MKILQIAPVRTDRASGVATYVLNLLGQLSLLRESQNALFSLYSEDLFDKKRLPGDCSYFPGPSRYHGNPWVIGTKWLNNIESRFGRPDLVHFHGIYWPMSSALSRQLLDRKWPYIVSVHGGLQPASQRRKAWKKVLGNIFFLDHFMKYARAVHVLNQKEAEAVNSRYPGIKTFIVSNGVPSGLLSYQTPVSEERCSVCTFGFIGRIDTDNKGVDLLLKAFLLLEEEHPEFNWRLFLVGDFFTAKDRAVVFGLIKRFKDPARIILTGPLNGEKKWNILAKFDVFVLTSRYEGMPTSVIEAMAFAKPCLVTPGTNMQTLISNCDGGWSCGTLPRSIADVLSELLKMPQAISQKGANARLYVNNHLTWEVVAKEYIKAIQTFL